LSGLSQRPCSGPAHRRLCVCGYHRQLWPSPFRREGPSSAC
jgi:hypothetical protein